jgi:hypothetical protein
VYVCVHVLVECVCLYIVDPDCVYLVFILFGISIYPFGEGFCVIAVLLFIPPEDQRELILESALFFIRSSTTHMAADRI